MSNVLYAVAIVAHVSVALAYIGTGIYVAPKFFLAATPTAASIARKAAIVFFFIGGLVRFEAAYDIYAAWMLGATPGGIFLSLSWPGVALQLLQGSAGWLFLFTAARFLSIRVENMKLYEKVLDRRYSEVEEALKVAATAGEVIREEEWKELLDSAVEGDAINTVFQPIRLLSSGVIVGREALTRFADTTHSTEGWFLAAEAYGGVEELEMATLCEALRHIDGDGLSPDHYVSINVSQRTMLSPRLIKALKEFDNTHRVVLELTERISVANYRSLADAVKPLKAMGVRIAVDDVGSGFAAMRRIVEVEPEFIKMDRLITCRLEDSEYAQAMLRSMVQFAQEIGSQAILEGVETKEELSIAKGLGVRFGQGYLLGRPEKLGRL